MQTLLPNRMRIISSLLTAVGVAFAAAAWACPDTKTAGPCSPLPTDETAETSFSGPNPDPALDAPVLSGVPGAARFRDGDTRLLDSPLSWLLGTTGPKGGVRLSAERLARAPERKPSVSSEAPRPSKESAARRGAKTRGGSGGHIAKPHRMPSIEIL